MTQLLPVLDLLNGTVVRGVQGKRDVYAPVQSVIAADAQPQTIAAALVARGFSRCYVADLDAILYGRLSRRAVDHILRAGLEVWLDAGLDALPDWPDDFQRQLDSVIVGAETVSSPERLRTQLQYWGRRAVLSLDMQGGRLMGSWGDVSPLELAQLAYESGCRRFIALDLAAVGVGRGLTTLRLCRQLRRRLPEIELTTGGGIRDEHDLRRLQAGGCDFALVASAIHNGSLPAPGKA